MGRRQSGLNALAQFPGALDSNSPRGEQVVSHLRRLVSELAAGTEIPSERAIADHFKIARMTAREAVEKLVEQGWVERRPRSGTFVSQPQFVHTRHLASYDADIQARGMVPGGRTVSVSTDPASDEVAALLGIEAGEMCLHLVRLRTADGDPLAVSRSNIALARFPGIDETVYDGMSLHETLYERWGVRAASNTQRMRATTLPAGDARLLSVKAGAAALEIRGVSRDLEGDVIEVAISTYRADRYEVVLHTDLSDSD